MLKTILTQTNIKKILTRGLVIVLGMAWTFADGQDPVLLKKAALMHNIIVFLSWIWVLLSMLAGKLMTNGLLYGGAFGLDIYLWTIRNAMKNIANFALGFIFLIVVIKEIFAFDIQDSLADISKKIGWFLIGGVLIQASWFIILALISLSTILSTSIAALPSMVIQSDNTRGGKIITAVNSKGALKGSSYTIKNSSSGSPKNLTLQYTTGTNVIGEQETLDFLMPRYDNLGGPLYFMGLSVIGFQEYASFNPTTSTDLKTMITGFTIKLIITFGYAALLIILILVNIVRIVKIWIFIALFPLNIALWVLKKEEISILGEDDMSIGGYIGKFDRGSLIQMIMQPTIIIGIMGLSMIMLTGFWSVLGSTSNANTDAINAAYNVTMTNDRFVSDSVDVHMMGNLLDGTIQQTGGIFQSLILIGLTFGLMGLILYVSAKVTKEKWLQDLTKSAGKLMTQIPFLPITQRMGAITKAADNMSGGKLREAYTNFTGGKGMQLDSEARDNMEELLGVSNTRKENQFKYQIRTAKDFDTLKNASSSRYSSQKIKDFQQIYTSEGRQENFVKHYRQIPNSPLGDIPSGDPGIKALNKAMHDKEKRKKLRPYLFPGVGTDVTIKGFDEQDKRGNTIVDESSATDDKKPAG